MLKQPKHLQLRPPTSHLYLTAQDLNKAHATSGSLAESLNVRILDYTPMGASQSNYSLRDPSLEYMVLRLRSGNAYSEQTRESLAREPRLYLYRLQLRRQGCSLNYITTESL